MDAARPRVVFFRGSGPGVGWPDANTVWPMNMMRMHFIKSDMESYIGEESDRAAGRAYKIEGKGGRAVTG